MGERLILFTSFRPDLGGGAAILRSLVPAFENNDVDWLYAADHSPLPEATQIGPSMAGGSAWHDLTRTVALWSGLGTRTSRSILRTLASRGAGRFWVVGHGEGVIIAGALAALGARVHLTIHDDVPDGVFGRSRRYRALVPLVRMRYEQTLRAVASVDVVSDGMHSYYQRRLGLSSIVVRPYVPSLPTVSRPRPPDIDVASDELRVGHIGSIYSSEEWWTFLRALRTVALERGLRPRMLMIGLAAKYRSVPDDLTSLLEIIDDLPEAAAIGRLMSCQFLYAMYPFANSAAVFRQTSLPTKLTTYLQSRRPLFAHSPGDSTLVDMVRRHTLGIICTSPTVSGVEGALRQILATPVAQASYEKARAELYGIENVRRLETSLSNL